MAVKYSYLENALELFHVRDFYEFLGYEYSLSGKYAVSNNELCQKANELANSRFCKADYESGEGKKICSACGLAFRDNEARAKYGVYLQWNKIRKILNQVKEIAEIKQNKLERKQCEIFLKQLKAVLAEEKEAKNVFFEFCEKENIVYETEKQGKKAEEPKILSGRTKSIQYRKITYEKRKQEVSMEEKENKIRLEQIKQSVLSEETRSKPNIWTRLNFVQFIFLFTIREIILIQYVDLLLRFLFIIGVIFFLGFVLGNYAKNYLEQERREKAKNIYMLAECLFFIGCIIEFCIGYMVYLNYLDYLNYMR
jgi:hypothetical protein